MTTITDKQLLDMMQGYFDVMQWLEFDSDDDCEHLGIPENEGFEVNKRAIMAEIKAVVQDFIEKASDEKVILAASALSEAFYSVGHDIYLTSKGHGAGFWDRGLGELGDLLTKACDGLDCIEVYYKDGFVTV